MLFSGKWVFVCTYLLLETCITAYKPVVIIHGVLAGNSTMLPMAEHIQQVNFVFLNERAIQGEGRRDYNSLIYS
jgi:hypothetical protein